MSRSQLERIVMCVCGLSPAFLITGVGASMLGSAADGRILLRGQLFSQIVMLLLTRNIAPDERLPEGDASVNPEPVRAAVMNILAVCGYMCLFSVAAAMIERAVRSKMAGMIALCLLDAPSAARALASLSIGREAKLMLLAAVTGLGGACIAAQNLAACKKMGVKTGKYILARVSHALLCAAAVAVQLRWNTKTAHFSMRPMEFSALIAAFLSVPVLIFWKKDPFLNKRILPGDDKKASKIREKTQYDVSE